MGVIPNPPPPPPAALGANRIAGDIASVGTPGQRSGVRTNQTGRALPGSGWVLAPPGQGLGAGESGRPCEPALGGGGIPGGESRAAEVPARHLGRVSPCLDSSSSGSGKSATQSCAGRNLPCFTGDTSSAPPVHQTLAQPDTMPNFAGTWKMRSSENFDELLKALGVNAMLRKVAVAAASKPHVEIRQDGDQFYIKTATTVRTTEINFKVGEGFDEETVDGRKCRSLPTWENENKIYCTQTLVEGDGPKTYWTRELANDELILTFGADDVVCTRIYVRE
ncbi:cellular retinoic acid-binding protein 1 isoform X2 [Petaurus breviceps papuanus]